jgi:conjugal transfer pilus assembly protein TrbC
VPAPFDRIRTHRRWLAAALLAPCLALGQQATPPAGSAAGKDTSRMPPARSSQPANWPGPEDMERAIQARPLPTPERLATQPLRAVPRIALEGLPATTAGNIDIAALARQGAALSAPPTAGTGAGAGDSVLRVFITLEMPRASLQRLVDQAERAGATLVLRGLKAQSMRQTVAAASDLIGYKRVSWVIDPNAFQRFQVSAAPTFVLMLPGPSTPGSLGAGPVLSPNISPNADLPRCGPTGCAAPASPADYLSVSGDVSLDYALDVMVRRSVDATPVASTFLQRLRKP